MGLSKEDLRFCSLISLRKFNQNVARVVGLSRHEAHELGAWEGPIVAIRSSVLGAKGARGHTYLYFGKLPDIYSRDSELGMSWRAYGGTPATWRGGAVWCCRRSTVGTSSPGDGA